MSIIETENERTSILIVDDRVENLLALEGWLEDLNLDIIRATSGNEALGRMLEDDFALVLLDVQMPGMDGFETLELMRGTERTRLVPVIFVTALSKEEQYILRGYQGGAVDYILKPVDPHILRSKVTFFVNLHQQNQKLQQAIAQLNRANAKIKKLSVRDGLTGCFNRRYFNDQLLREIKRATRYKTVMALVLTDIDHFKKVNDAHGHQFGDEVLKVFADVLQTRIRKDIDWVARYGGEEFAIVLPETNLQGAAATAEKLRQAVAETSINCQNVRVPISASFGVAALDSFLADADNATHELLSIADKRMYAAKNGGRNRVMAERIQTQHG